MIKIKTLTKAFNTEAKELFNDNAEVVLQNIGLKGPDFKYINLNGIVKMNTRTVPFTIEYPDGKSADYIMGMFKVIMNDASLKCEEVREIDAADIDV